MRILFVHGQLGTGGIETLILRWCRELRQQGHTPIVAVRTEGKGSLAPQVRRYADIAYLRHLTIPLLTGFRVGVNSFRAYTRSGVDVVYCMDPSMLLVATQLAARCPGAKLVAGVYHPAAYCFRGNLLTPEQELTRDLFHSLPVENVFFMNEAVRAAHERFLARDFQRSTIVPLAVDVDRFLQLKRQPSRHRVVSVGRLVDFKCYTFPTIDVVLSLNAEGHDFVYDIYGSGPERSRLERYVKARGAATVVKLHGAVPYEALESAFVEAFAFVGMGTALVESAASGVPSLVAIESNTAATCYGFFHATTDYSVGEHCPAREESLIADHLRALVELSPTSYERISEQGRGAAARFDVARVTTRFAEAIEAAKPGTPSAGLLWRTAVLFERAVFRALRLFGVEHPSYGRFLRPFDVASSEVQPLVATSNVTTRGRLERAPGGIATKLPRSARRGSN